MFEIQNTGTVAAPVYASAPTTLVSFNGSNGANPYAGLTADANGDLFGTTDGGGANGDGTVFEITGAGFVVAALRRLRERSAARRRRRRRRSSRSRM